MRKDPVAHKLPFDHGEFLCTWSVEDHDGGTVELQGLLTLEDGKYPQGALYGELPLKSNGGAIAFPQQQDFSSIVGRLSSGGSVALMNGSLEYLFLNQGQATGAFSILSRSDLSAKIIRKYDSIDIQMDGLDAILGKAPISEVRFPKDSTVEPVWSAKTNKEANVSWDAEAFHMAISYSAAIRSFDAYEFRMVFGAVLKIRSDDPLTVEEWWTRWVQPLRSLVSLITRKTSDIHSLLATPEGGKLGAPKDQVFGLGITQKSQNTSSDKVRSVKPLVNVDDDDANLLALLVNWQSRVDDRHPLLETYGTMLTVTDQHPRSRVLLYLQALEGLFGFESADEREKDEAAYTAKRESVVQRVEGSSLERSDFKFIKKNLQRRPMSGLQNALIRIFDSLIVDLRPKLNDTELINKIRLSDSTLAKESVEKILVKVRNDLSHGSASYEPWDLERLANILERIVRSESLRVIDAPESSRKRALKD